MRYRLPSAPKATAPVSGIMKEHGNDGWGIYLLAAIVLVPILVPAGPAQSAIVDTLNILALIAFLLFVVLRREPVRMPFLGPMILVVAGSLLAVTNAPSVSLSLVTLTQDIYLYVWFLLLVHQMADRGRLRLIRVTWMWTAIGVVAFGLTVLAVMNPGSLAGLLAPAGVRATSTFTNPNYYADFLVLSLFIALSMTGDVWMPFVLLAVVALLVGIASTKSNGAAIALTAGLIGYAFVRARLKGVQPLRILGVGAISMALLLVAWSLVSEWGIGAAFMKQVRQESFAARMEHSGESRMRIWAQLRETYARSPLGIGPGNSSAMTVPVEGRERPASLQSKEAHSDFLGFAIERGPIAVLGLLLLLIESFRRLAKFGAQAKSTVGERAWMDSFSAAMIGGLIATTVHSLVIEKWHFRHFWLYLAVICAVTDPKSIGRRVGESHSFGRSKISGGTRGPGEALQES